MKALTIVTMEKDIEAIKESMKALQERPVPKPNETRSCGGGEQKEELAISKEAAGATNGDDIHAVVESAYAGAEVGPPRALYDAELDRRLMKHLQHTELQRRLSPSIGATESRLGEAPLVVDELIFVDVTELQEGEHPGFQECSLYLVEEI